MQREFKQRSAAQTLGAIKQLECRDATYFSKDPSLVFAGARGSEVFDTEARSYIDLCAGFGVLALGHHPQEFREVWREFSEGGTPGVMHAMGDVYPGADKLLLFQELAKVLPPALNKFALALSGAQAVEYAMKTALLHTKKSGFICLTGAYHGLDFGALSLTFRDDFKTGQRDWLHTERVVFIDPTLDPDRFEKDLRSACSTLDAQGFGVAAIVAEPVQGRAGIRAISDEKLRMMRKVCDEKSALLIYDEVFTGLGRIGSMTKAFEVACDLLCLGKPLGGGLPLSACVGRNDVMNAWPENTGEAMYTGTFFGHPLACRLGALTLRAIDREQLSQRSLKLGGTIKSYLTEALASCSLIREVRGQGLMIAIEFNQPGLGARLMDPLRAAGVIILPSGPCGESLSLTPALNIPENLLFTALEKICLEIKKLVL